MSKKQYMAGFIIALFFFTPNLFALSPEIQFDMLKAKLSQQLKAQEYVQALETMGKIKTLGKAVPASLEYFEGKALFESGQKYKAYTKLEKYVETNGKSAKYYNQAISYLVKAETTYNAEKEKIELERIAAEKRAQKQYEKEALLRKEAEEFSALPQIDKKFSSTGLFWTLPVPKKYRDNPFLPVKAYGTKQEAQSYCENLVIDGYDDWRIATMKEFSTISGKGNKYSSITWGEDPYTHIWAWGSPEFSDANHSYNKDQIYAVRTQATTAAGPEGIMCVRIDKQELFDNYFKHSYQIIEHKENTIMMEDRYMISSDQCYFVDPSVTFDSAVKYCKKLTLGGYDDWRVPTKEDMLEKLPCHIAKNLFFLRDSPSYNDLWYGNQSLFSKKVGYQKQNECIIRPANISDRHKVRCVRNVVKKKTDTQQNVNPPAEL
ncbi:MAG: hypothetical protein PF495_21535 [Spirochaetales bacterium]|nr:hypothetical protein [Spirochaetales bacterium]